MQYNFIKKHLIKIRRRGSWAIGAASRRAFFKIRYNQPIVGTRRWNSEQSGNTRRTAAKCAFGDTKQPQGTDPVFRPSHRRMRARVLDFRRSRHKQHIVFGSNERQLGQSERRNQAPINQQTDFQLIRTERQHERKSVHYPVGFYVPVEVRLRAASAYTMPMTSIYQKSKII